MSRSIESAPVRLSPSRRPAAVKPRLSLSAAAPRSRLVGGVAVFSLDGPPPSCWSEEERARLVDTLERAAADPAVKAVVLHGDRLFAERPQDRRGRVDPTFHPLLAAIAHSPKPVIAAIAGDAVGCGLELALACAARIAGPRAHFALPGVRHGRIAVNGAIERLPRLIGTDAAARMLMFGALTDAATALDCGLIDRIAEGDVVVAAIDRARRALNRGPADEPCPTHGEPSPGLCKALLTLRQQAPDQTAPLAVLRAMENAHRLPLRRSLAETLRAAQTFAGSEQAEALAYAEAGIAALETAMANGDLDVAALTAQLRWPCLREAVHLLDEGATPAQIDRVLTRYGLSEGPFAKADRQGLSMVFPAGQPWLSYSPTLDLMADARREGGPGNPGWYRPVTPECPNLQFDPEVDQLLRGAATFQMIARKPVADELIVERCLHAVINGAALVLHEIGDDQAHIVDSIVATVLGFPRWKGGPLYQADRMGLDRVVATLRTMHARRNTAGPPAGLLVGRASRGECLTRTPAA